MDRQFGEVGREQLTELLNYFARKTFKATDVDAEAHTIQEKCIELFAKDYTCSIISNVGGALCSHYPSKIVICQCRTLEELSDDATSPQSLFDLFSKSRAARCRSRFVVPVILFDGKNICRSATLSSAPEIYGRSGYDFFFAGKNESTSNGKTTTPPVEEENGSEASTEPDEWDLFNRIRGRDVSLLRKLSVKYIYDLMVERKKVKFGVNITSSEKVDKEKRYAEFTISSVPYPGCEFFRDYKNNCYSGEGIYFDWSQAFVDANLNIPPTMPLPSGIDWKCYKNWDLVTLTQNYILFVLKLLKDGDGGVLIHCISGWDRTPLFISLIRLSLWADGRIHHSLSPAEILYLTIGYDWLLFGHDLEDRLTKGEEVFFFCFNFLKHIVSDEFSINITRSSSLPLLSKPRAESLSQLDGQVLLLADDRPLGSCTSLNSQSSLHSERTLSETPLMEDAVDDSSVSSNGSFTSLNAVQMHSWSSGHKSVRHTPNSPPMISTPVPVPSQQHSHGGSVPSEHRSSFCGSWQIISDAGSPRGTTTMRDVPLPIGRSSSSNSLCEAAESPRQQKLEAVRSLFLNAYACSVGYRTDQSQGFSGMLDNVAARMLKGTWMSSV